MHHARRPANSRPARNTYVEGRSPLHPVEESKSFSGWTKAFADPRLCAAVVDRLTFGGNLIQTGTESNRLTTTQARAAAQEVASGSPHTRPFPR